MKNNKTKKGVSLIILVITVILLSILAAVISINTTLMTDEAREAKFKDELKTIEDRIKEYYVLTGTLPVLPGTEYSLGEVIALNTRGKELALKSEIDKNGDTSSKFYLIDYEAIGVTLNERGNGKTVDDIYVLSSVANKVYYVRGLEIKENVYFSISGPSAIGE